MPNPVKISVLVSLYHGEIFLRGFFKHLAAIQNPETLEIVIIHNEPSDYEIELIQSSKKEIKAKIVHHIVDRRETLYKSWNRGIKLASGRYITIWNVDDVRLPDSLARQARILDEESDLDFTYGDQIDIQSYGETKGVRIIVPEYAENPGLFLTGFYIGSFPMWRRSLHDVAGYFDEQFRSAGDYDFFVRAARNRAGGKTAGVLGYYLASQGISKSGSMNNIERTFVELRYAQYQKLNYVYLLPALIRYRILKILSYGMNYRVGQFFPNYQFYMISRIYTIPVGLLLFPFRHLFPMIWRKLSRYA